MNNFDDIFDAPEAKKSRNDQTFDKGAWAEKKQAERKTVYDLADSTAETVAADGGKFRDYLDVQTRFSRYTATNALLILAQMPQATQLKDFESWRSTGAYIKRQEMGHGISILEPGDEYQREDGSVGTFYNVKKVYDVSQTSTRAKVQPVVSVDERMLLRALIHNPPVPMQTVDTLPNNMGALYDHDQGVIFVRRGMAADDIFRSVSKLPLLHTAFPICCAERTALMSAAMISAACPMISAKQTPRASVPHSQKCGIRPMAFPGVCTVYWSKARQQKPKNRSDKPWEKKNGAY